VKGQSKEKLREKGHLKHILEGIRETGHFKSGKKKKWAFPPGSSVSIQGGKTMKRVSTLKKVLGLKPKWRRDTLWKSNQNNTKRKLVVLGGGSRKKTESRPL